MEQWHNYTRQQWHNYTRQQWHNYTRQQWHNYTRQQWHNYTRQQLTNAIIIGCGSIYLYNYIFRLISTSAETYVLEKYVRLLTMVTISERLNVLMIRTRVC